ncbi:hypothetical protein [Gluconacetobacter sacchari]|nr:hypothetical protein [Gluconacetobacter sacchari]
MAPETYSIYGQYLQASDEFQSELYVPNLKYSAICVGDVNRSLMEIAYDGTIFGNIDDMPAAARVLHNCICGQRSLYGLPDHWPIQDVPVLSVKYADTGCRWSEWFAAVVPKDAPHLPNDAHTIEFWADGRIVGIPDSSMPLARAFWDEFMRLFNAEKS